MTPQFRPNKDIYDQEIAIKGMFREEDCPFCHDEEAVNESA